MISGSVQIEGHDLTIQYKPRVVLRSIIHEAVLGMAFLERFRVTFDVAAQR
jgi:hypothetical protein